MKTLIVRHVVFESRQVVTLLVTDSDGLLRSWDVSEVVRQIHRREAEFVLETESGRVYLSVDESWQGLMLTDRRQHELLRGLPRVTESVLFQLIRDEIVQSRQQRTIVLSPPY